MIRVKESSITTPRLAYGIQELMKRKEDVVLDYDISFSYDSTLPEQAYQMLSIGKEIVITGSEDIGIMYALFDLADGIQNGILLPEGKLTAEPYIKRRGIKLNIPLDARTPSYSDASDSAQRNIVAMWSFSFWKNYLDGMARNKYNVLSLWSLSPFPSMVRIPEYPLTALSDVMVTTKPIKATTTGKNMQTKDTKSSLVRMITMSIEEKIEFWRCVMQYAWERGIRIYLFTWNVFTYGTEDSPYGITDDQNNIITEDYLYCAVKALLHTYPLLAGIGITAGENMQRADEDIAFLGRTYGRAVREVMSEQSGRDFTLIHRYHYANYEAICREFQDFPCDFCISFKYSQAHMYSTIKPSFINDFLQKRARDERSSSSKIWLTIRNDDFYFLRWGNPEFARQYLLNMPVDQMEGFYLGSDGYTWGNDYSEKKSNRRQNYLERNRYQIAIWGRMAYCPQLTEEYFMDYLSREYNNVDIPLFYKAWKYASQIIPLLNCAHWHDYDFQWYPEGCCMYDQDEDKLLFADINEFVSCPCVPGDAYISVGDYCRAKLHGEEITAITPLDIGNSIRMCAREAKNILVELKKQKGNQEEYQEILDDISLTILLGNYYADKLEVAVMVCLGRMELDKKALTIAAEMLRKATSNWEL